MTYMNKIEYGVFHHTAAEASKVSSYEQVAMVKRIGAKKGFPSTYHYLITANGQVNELARPGIVVPHAGFDIGEYYINNWNAVGICCGANLEVEQMGPAMFNGVVSVVKHISKTYNIPKDRFVPHKALVATQCPGKNFPFNWVIQEAFMAQENKPWYYDVLEWAKKKKIVTGDENGVINLNDDQLIALTMIYKYDKSVHGGS